MADTPPDDFVAGRELLADWGMDVEVGGMGCESRRRGCCVGLACRNGGARNIIEVSEIVRAGLVFLCDASRPFCGLPPFLPGQSLRKLGQDGKGRVSG